jgi:prophage maintenance system killer protein/predicted transcriptional regulator
MVKKIPDIKNKIILYTDKRGNVELRADVEKETIWATLDQIAGLFGRDKSVISRHLKGVFDEAELDRKATVAKNATVQKEGDREVIREIEYYNLDAILSVGYRVNSKQATQFRIWATKTLREYLVKGLVVNTRRLEQIPNRMIKDLDEKIKFIQRTIKKRELNQPEVDSLLSVIGDYAHAWTTLQKYDEGDIVLKKGKLKEKQRFDYDFVRPAVEMLKVELMKKGEASELFGSERDGSFQGILKTIYQTFDGKELYASLEEKAAHLLYFIIKDHPFSDGNKRIGSFVFVYFLGQNDIMRRINGEKKISDNTLVALALLIAESDPKDKHMMVALTTNLLV